MQARIHCFLTLYAFSRGFRVKKPQNIARTWRNIRLLFEFFQILHGRPQWAYPHTGKNLCVARSTPCSMVVVRVAGRASLDALFLHINKIDPNFFPHTSITMQSTHDKFHWVMTFYIFYWIFPVTNPKTLAERDTRCIWCSNSFNFCMKACHACPHADKICVISCMPRSTSCSKVGVRVGR